MPHMEGSCQLTVEKIACTVNKTKSDTVLFQMVSIHFSKVLIAVILEECQKGNTGEMTHSKVN